MSDVGIGVGAHYYSIPDSLYKEVYREASLMFNGFLSFEFTKNLEFRAEFNHFKKNGETTYKQEPVTLTLTPLIAGIRFKIAAGMITPYVGAGIAYFLYNEDVPESFGEDVSDSTIGFHGEVGVYFHLSKKLLLDINGRYVKADAKPFEEKIGLGGISAGVGVKYSF